MLSYQIKRGDRVNLYFTGKYEVVEKMINKFPKVLVGSLSTVQIFDNEEILGIYDKIRKWRVSRTSYSHIWCDKRECRNYK